MSKYNFSTLTLNSTNLVPSVAQNVYSYRFPINALLKQEDAVAISSISMYNSFYNIKSEYGNNTFQYRWYTGATSNVYTVVIPDGNYSFADINTYLQSVMVSNKTYLINSSGQFVYYLSIAENLTTYKVDITCFNVPTSLPVGWTLPVGAPALPTTSYTPEIIIPATDITILFGLNAGTYPSTPVIGTSTTSSSTFTPQITQITSVLVSSNVCNSPYSTPANIVFSFPIDVQFGELMSPPVNELVYNQVSGGYFTSLDITFLDNLYRPLQIRDTNITIAVVIRSKNDNRA